MLAPVRDGKPAEIFHYDRSPVFRVLGRIEAGHGADRIDIGRRRERCLLGVLLLEAGRVVAVDRLLDLLWETPPATARSSLHTHVARLRTALQRVADVHLLSVGGGYLLRADCASVDAHRFAALVHQARRTGELADRARLLESALALWRGPVLAADAEPRLRARIGTQVTELRSAAVELLMDTRLALGRHDQLIVDVTMLAGEQPYNERLTAQLMTALYRSGRQADALAEFERLRVRLRGDLGVEPGPGLQRVRAAILRQDPELTVPE